MTLSLKQISSRQYKLEVNRAINGDPYEVLQALFLGKSVQEKLERVFMGFVSLKQLVEIDLSGNLLTHLPESMAHLGHLKVLNVSENCLSESQESLGVISKIKRLQELDLSCNNLKRLPESFGQLTQLERLDLRYNQLEHLPECFRQLMNLAELKVSNNKLKDLPKGIHLKQLPKLDLSFTQTYTKEGKNPNHFLQLCNKTLLKILNYVGGHGLSLSKVNKRFYHLVCDNTHFGTVKNAFYAIEKEFQRDFPSGKHGYFIEENNREKEMFKALFYSFQSKPKERLYGNTMMTQKEFRNQNPNFERLLILKCPEYLSSSDLESPSRRDRHIILKIVRIDGRKLWCASERLRDDEEIVYTAVSQDCRALEYASERLKGNERIVRTVLSHLTVR